MNGCVLFILFSVCLIVLFLVIVIVVNRCKVVDSFDSIDNSGTGNQIVARLFNTIKKKVTGTSVKFTISLRNNKYNLLEPNANEIEQFKKLDHGVWNVRSVSSWHKIRWGSNIWDEYNKYWMLSGPILHRYFSKVLPKVDVDVPVIHMRCSDSPMIKHSCYHTPKSDLLVKVADIVKDKGYKSVILLNCVSHRRENNAAVICGEIYNSYRTTLEKEGIEVIRQCKSKEEDLATMFYSPLLVSLTQSSFSFMIGITKPDRYITGLMGKEVNGKYVSASNLPWMSLGYEPLLHKDANFYNDKTIKQLIDCSDI